jgi:hypothetical protein
MQDEHLLRAAVEQAVAPYAIYPSSFAQIRTEYEQQYGKRGWIAHLTTDLTGKQPPSARGISSKSPEYKAAQAEWKEARRNIERWNQGTRSPGPAAREHLKEIGRTLPPLGQDAPPQGLTLTVDFYAPADSEHASQRTRQAIISMDYPTAVQFVQDPNWADAWDLWFDDGDEVYGEDGDYAADVFGVSAA